jgi:hypothetical protein
MMKPMAIDLSRFNNAAYLESRIGAATKADQPALRTALAYLYNDDGPINLPRVRLLLAKRHLDPAERVVIVWLYTRTNGNQRKSYGAGALRSARSSRYRCKSCGFTDVRALNLHHVNGHTTGTPFDCLCANCHTIKSRKSDWVGKPSLVTQNKKDKKGIRTILQH